MNEQGPSNENSAGIDADGHVDLDVGSIEASLERLFRPPSGVGQRLRSLIENPTKARALNTASSAGFRRSESQVSSDGPSRHRGGGHGGGASSGLRPMLALAGAAVLALVLIPRPHPNGDSTSVASESVARSESSLGLVPLSPGESAALSVSVCPEDSFDWRRQEDPFRSAPDLASIYHEVIASAGDQAGQAGHSWDCTSQTAGDSLVASLRDSYGTKLRTGSDASRFAGPFPLTEWRGGAVLAGFPEEGGLPSVLIADTESALRCCIDLVQPRDSSLRVFAWRVGDILWIEVTQRTQPRFLDRFELL